MIVISSHAQLNKLVAQVRDEVFNRLKPEDYQYLLQSSRLLSLRNVNPSRCTGEANIVFHDPTVPRCWRARAGVYRAEALMALGFSKLAKDQLILTGRLLESEDYPQQIDLMDRKRYEILEALVAWNIALGKINWGIVEFESRSDSPVDGDHKVKSSTIIQSSSGKFLSAGYPSSLSLAALDLKYC